MTSAFQFTYAYIRPLWLELSLFVCVYIAFPWGLIHPCTFTHSFISNKSIFEGLPIPSVGAAHSVSALGMNGVVRGCYPSGCWVARWQTLEEGVWLLVCEKRTSTHIFMQWVEISCFILAVYCFDFGLGFWFLCDMTVPQYIIYNLWLSSCFSLTCHTWFSVSLRQGLRL